MDRREAYGAAAFNCSDMASAILSWRGVLDCLVRHIIREALERAAETKVGACSRSHALIIGDRCLWHIDIFSVSMSLVGGRDIHANE